MLRLVVAPDDSTALLQADQGKRRCRKGSGRAGRDASRDPDLLARARVHHEKIQHGGGGTGNDISRRHGHRGRPGNPVRAAASGYVTGAEWNDSYGYYVQIDHGYGIKTLYAHADMLVVSKGERVAQGQTIAYSGNTGNSTAPHLHFEVTQNNVPVDPLKYLLE